MNWLLSALLAFGALPAAQVQPPVYRDRQTAPPVFREDVYAVPVHIALFERRDRQDIPWAGLTRDDFILILDKKPFAAVAVAESPEKPGHYAIYFQPPVQHRDGKIHDIKLKVKFNGKWKTLPTKWPTMLPKKGSGRFLRKA